jgi:hypothetical protein
MKVKHRYQPRIQEGGLAEAWVGIHWAAGGETAQRESTYKRDRIREKGVVAHSGNKIGYGSLQTTPPYCYHLGERASAAVYGCLLGQGFHSPDAALVQNPGHP